MPNGELWTAAIILLYLPEKMILFCDGRLKELMTLFGHYILPSAVVEGWGSSLVQVADRGFKDLFILVVAKALNSAIEVAS